MLRPRAARYHPSARGGAKGGSKMTRKLKLMTVLGTRPEIIRLSAVMRCADRYFDHVVVHTGQN